MATIGPKTAIGDGHDQATVLKSANRGMAFHAGSRRMSW
jgi:hypothetical protein